MTNILLSSCSDETAVRDLVSECGQAVSAGLMRLRQSLYMGDGQQALVLLR